MALGQFLFEIQHYYLKAIDKHILLHGRITKYNIVQMQFKCAQTFQSTCEADYNNLTKNGVTHSAHT